MSRSRNGYRLASWWLRNRPASTRVDDAGETGAVPAEDVGTGKTVDAIDQLKHGYTIADLHAITRLAVHTAGSMASDWHERYDTAWSGIAEHLYAAEEPPTRPEMVRAGQLAIYAVVDEQRQAHGYYRRKTDGAQHGAASSPAFRKYWWDLCGATHSGSPEGKVVERLALSQILPTLTPRQRQAIMALAVHDDYRAAAQALNMPYSTFNGYIALARRRYLALEHEGMKPPKPWGTDRRVGSYAKGRGSDSRSLGGLLADRAKPGCRS